MTRKEMVEGILSKDIPLHSASIHERGEVGAVDLEANQLAALRMEWRKGGFKFVQFITFTKELIEKMDGEGFADFFHDATRRHLKRKYAA